MLPIIEHNFDNAFKIFHELSKGSTCVCLHRCPVIRLANPDNIVM